MLPGEHRIIAKSDFRDVIKAGKRLHKSTMVIYWKEDNSYPTGPMVGFVVSKAVGNAVVRNLVKRRLRAIVANNISKLPRHSKLIVRALPNASKAPYRDLESDFVAATGIKY